VRPAARPPTLTRVPARQARRRARDALAACRTQAALIAAMGEQPGLARALVERTHHSPHSPTRLVTMP
ncbi:MAG: hypothetical protein RLW62_17345, partial [Gammaproteobacteria bacterium]